ncbi:MAG: guanylate kinase [Actinomycetota bacterium]|nr:guanylate kinase [Actinomycetota bacterium]
MSKGRLFVVAGPSGAGKGTLIAELEERYPQVWISISATTRKPRSDEKEGMQYYFLEREDFERRAGRGEFLEWAEVHGNLYGTPLSSVKEKRSRGRDVILEIDVEGAEQVRAREPDAVNVFVMPPSMKVLERRLRKRGTEGEEELKRRMRNAREESKAKDDFDYIIINDDLDRAAGELCAIYVRESPFRKDAS